MEGTLRDGARRAIGGIAYEVRLSNLWSICDSVRDGRSYARGQFDVSFRNYVYRKFTSYPFLSKDLREEKSRSITWYLGLGCMIQVMIQYEVKYPCQSSNHPNKHMHPHHNQPNKTTTTICK
jgi:hypothetical protein